MKITKKSLKRIISAAISICLLFGLQSTVFAANDNNLYYKYMSDYEFIPGDANNDYEVNVDDVTFIQSSFINDSSDFSKQAEKAADFNGDGYINIDDVTDIQKMMVGIDYTSVAIPNDAYKSIAVDFVKKAGFENQLEVEMIVDGIKLEKNKALEGGWYFIRSLDEYYDLFGCCRGLIDNKFFKDNALIVRIKNNPLYYDNGDISEAAVDGNVMNLKMVYKEPFIDLEFEYPMEFSWYQMFIVDKTDTAEVSSISVVEEYQQMY